ncbi:MAG: hypothetical protein EDS66_17650 [Planctomycetota bacterium]|nr:MAG: hypothetical protein EDS66_17650 [Planctomycetota bacterium]
MIDTDRISRHIQSELPRRGLDRATAVQAGRWMDKAEILKDSRHRPGRPLRNILRADKSRIADACQEPARKHGRWFIDPEAKP